MISRRLLNTSLLLAGLFPRRAQAAAPGESLDLPPSLANLGDLRPLACVLKKAAAGQTIRVLGVGGSITAGAGASAPDRRWLNLVAAHLQRRTGTEVTLINAGVSDTKTDYGALRLERDVLSQEPDLVFLDAAVNDDPADAASYDSMVRRILFERICLVPIMFGTYSFGGIQHVLLPICRYYDLPVVSYADAAREAVRSGVLRQTDLTAPDGIHPTDVGHALAARCVEALISRAAEQVRKPLYANSFDRVTLLSDEALSYALMHGFTYIPNPSVGPSETTGAWRSDRPGDWLTLPVTVRGDGNIWLLIERFRQRGGTLRVKVGSQAGSLIEAHDAGLPVDERLCVIQVARRLAPGTYMLRLENVTRGPSAFLWICGVGLSR